MSAPPNRQARAAAEAATWFARLNATAVSAEDLEQFQAWRRRPRNDAAFTSVERIWRESGALQNDPDIQAALKSTKDGHGGRRRSAGAAVWWRAGVVSALATGGLFALMAIDFDGLRYGQMHKTAIGEERVVSLADGSRVRLDTNTRLAVRMTADSRRITLLGGQAYFEVAHDRTRPFVVDAAGTEIRAVGTQFDVRKDAGAVRVTLIEGVVKVHSPGPKEPALTLRQGQALAVINGGRPITSRLTDLRSSTGWITGHLYFDERPLSEAVAEMNRYSRKRVDLDAPGLGEILVSGAFETGDPDAFISAVCKLYGLKASPQTNGSVVLRTQPPAAATKVN